jgi:hypothetical protein
MSLTLGLTGMDPATETALKSAFTEANAGIGGAWQLVPEPDAAYVVVDMDTLYGPMSWLRLHAADKSVIGLTTAARTQADFRLERPFTAESLRAMLCDVALAAGQPIIPPAPAAAVASEPASSVELTDAFPEFFADLAGAIPTGRAAPPETEAAAATAAPSVAAAVSPAPAAPAPVTPSLPDAWTAPEAAKAPAHAHVPTPAAAPAPAAPTTLAGWLASGQLKGRCRVRAGHLSVLVDNDQHTYYGPASLKPLIELFGQRMGRDSFEPVNEAAWEHDTAAQGGAQPLSRLMWFGALLGGNGTLASGYDPNDRFRLLKWPQTEREYPKHFRIATVMMKGPATLAEITDASGVTRQEVNDFVNANLATGFAEPYREPEPESDAGKAGGLFGRLRGR